MIELGALVLLGVAALFLVGLAIKAIVWVILLPIRLVFWLLGGLLLLPLLLFKFLLGGLILLISVPFIIISLVAALAAVVAGLLLPLLPLVLLVAVIWYFFRPQPQALVRG